ncbi:hypothetical protein IAT40_001956 [Kwoniella sp. CBS 6097]
MSNRNVTPTRVDLDNAPTPPLHPAPLRSCIYGSMSEIDCTPVRIVRPVPPGIKEVVTSALKMAQAIIVSPDSIKIAADVLAGTSSPDRRVSAAIHHALSKARFLIVLEELPLEQHARHARPEIDSACADLMENTIYLNRWYADRLLDARDAQNDKINPYTYQQHLIMTAMTIGHEIIHVLRRHVYLLLQGTSASIPYASPPRGVQVGSAVIEAEAGWTWEDNLLGGRFHGLWAFDIPSPEASAYDFSALNKALADDEDIEDLIPTIRHETKNVPFDFLVLQRAGKLYEVSDEWIGNCYDELNAVVWPPEVAPEPIEELKEYSAIFRRTRADLSHAIYRPTPPQK